MTVEHVAADAAAQAVAAAKTREEAIAAGGAVRVNDAREALAEAAAISGDARRREAMGTKALEFVAAHRGAVQRLMDWIEVKTAR